MLLEMTIRRFIKILETALVLIVFIFFAISYTETIATTQILFIPINIYVLSLSFFYYSSLLKISPGSIQTLDNTSICFKCNRLRNNRTFHCETCNKCYYKRDHHCPWIGKCIAENNYKEFYMFIMTLVVYLFMRMLKSNKYYEISFIFNSIFVTLALLFLWINFLLCIDKTSIEYSKGKSEKWNTEKLKDKFVFVLLEGDKRNIMYLLVPFLKKRAKITEIK